MRPIRPTLPLALALALIVPLTGQAEPIVVGPRTETLVEGHTVFLTIEAYQHEPDGAALSAHPARRAPVDDESELAAEATDAQLRVDRFPGVLWFNDQYLADPHTQTSTGLGTGSTVRSRYGAAMAVLVRADDGRVREPCGGAILAVNEGDPDPRRALVSVGGTDVLTGGRDDTSAIDVDPATGQVRSDGLATTQVDGVVAAAGMEGLVEPFDYRESYLLTDPSDHAWIVDVYTATSRLVLPDGTLDTYPYTVWATNVLGGPAFVPDPDMRVDDGTCVPHKEFIEALGGPADGMLCGVAASDSNMLGDADHDVTLNVYNGATAWTNDPCMGYTEPSRNGHCYGGQAMGPMGCQHGPGGQPLHRYHALLYFAWEDLVPSTSWVRDHCEFNPQLDIDDDGSPEGGCDPRGSPDTNGCQSATEWPCPGEDPWNGRPGADEFEGASHAFHPLVPPHKEAEPCMPMDGTATNPVNHGGSRHGRTGRCDHHHATAQVDVYFSGSARPPEPLARSFRIHDLEGSSAPFMDFHAAFPGVD